MTLETAVKSQKSKHQVNQLESQLEEAKKETTLMVNSRDQDRFRLQKNVEGLQTEIEDTILERQNLERQRGEKENQQKQLTQKISELEEEKEKRESKDGDRHSSEDEDQDLALDTLQGSKAMLTGIQTNQIPRRSGGAGCGGDEACCTIF